MTRKFTSDHRPEVVPSRDLNPLFNHLEWRTAQLDKDPHTLLLQPDGKLDDERKYWSPTVDALLYLVGNYRFARAQKRKWWEFWKPQYIMTHYYLSLYFDHNGFARSEFVEMVKVEVKKNPKDRYEGHQNRFIFMPELDCDPRLRVSYVHDPKGAEERLFTYKDIGLTSPKREAFLRGEDVPMADISALRSL